MANGVEEGGALQLAATPQGGQYTCRAASASSPLESVTHRVRLVHAASMQPPVAPVLRIVSHSNRSNSLQLDWQVGSNQGTPITRMSSYHIPLFLLSLLSPI